MTGPCASKHAPVTVLMSVKNGEPYIREAVQSVLDQAFSDFRFLILDNASTDTTRETICSFEDPRIDLVPLPEDIGQTGALNKGLSMITGGYVARLDADDVCLPDRLERQKEFLDDHAETALVGSAVENIDPDGNHLSHTSFPLMNRAILDSLPLGNQFAHSSVMYRHEPVMRAGGYDASFTYAQDLSLWLKLAAEHGLANVSDILVRVRVHPGQATRDERLRSVRLEDNLRLAKVMADLPGMSRQARQAALFRQAWMLWGLGRKGKAVRCAGGLFAGSLGLCLLNPILWRAAGNRVANGN